MRQNTEFYVARLIAFVIVILSMTCEASLRAGSVGADFAQSTLDKAQALTARYAGSPSEAQAIQKKDKEIQALINETSKQLSQMSETDRIDYVEYMATKLAKYGSNNKNDSETGEAALVFISAGPSLGEIAAGGGRLLSSNDPALQNTGQQLLKIDEVKLPSGEMGHDISTYNLALHDPKVPQDRLIGVMFKVAPVETAQWLADHADLPANDRAGLQSDLQQAWKLHHAPYGPAPDSETKATLALWLNSPSWILRSLANGLLQKHQEWQTSDLKKAMQPVQVPTGLQITPGQ
jgi:hypothetical protein